MSKEGFIEYRFEKDTYMYRECAEIEIKELLFSDELGRDATMPGDNHFSEDKKLSKVFTLIEPYKKNISGYILKISTKDLSFYVFKNSLIKLGNIERASFYYLTPITLKNVVSILKKDEDGSLHELNLDDMKEMYEKNRLRYITSSQRELFQRWIGKTVVRDNTGDPLVCYHGTAANINFLRFKQYNIKSNTGDVNAYLGSHFANSPYTAADIFSGGRDNARIIPVYLRIENPLEFYGFNSEDNMNKTIISHSKHKYFLFEMFEEKYAYMSQFGSLKSEMNELARDSFSQLKYFDETKARANYFDIIFRVRFNVLMQKYDVPMTSKILSELNVISQKYLRMSVEYAKRELIKKGYDGFIYANSGEDGIGYIPFSEKQIWWCLKDKHKYKKRA